MKHLFTFLFSFSLFIGFSQSRQLRLTLQSHNEMNDPVPYTNSTTWSQVKVKIAMLVDTLEFYSAKYNLQCESNFIRANISNDNAFNLTSDFLEIMENHPLIEVDPHNHLNLDVSAGLGYNPYNYADLAKLLDSCGITRITTAGGYLYQSSEWTYPSQEDWTTWDTGITGNYFSNYNWTPQMIWGGGTLSHVNDPFSLGVWRPSGATSTLFKNHSASSILNLGNGCSWVIQNNTNIDSLIAQLQDYTGYFTNYLPADPNMFVSGTVIFNYRFILTPGYVEKVCEFIRKVNPMILNNRIIWQTLGEKYTSWTTLHPNPVDSYLLFCDDLPSNLAIDKEFIQEAQIYPNPSNGIFTIENPEDALLVVYDLNGNECYHVNLNAGINSINPNIQKGIYLVKVLTENSSSIIRLLIE